MGNFDHAGRAGTDEIIYTFTDSDPKDAAERRDLIEDAISRWPEPVPGHDQGTWDSEGVVSASDFTDSDGTTLSDDYGDYISAAEVALDRKAHDLAMAQLASKTDEELAVDEVQFHFDWSDVLDAIISPDTDYYVPTSDFTAERERRAAERAAEASDDE